jgi:putative oxidoreductase
VLPRSKGMLLGRYAELIYGVTRIVTGMMYWMHGTTKLLGFPPGARGAGRSVELFSLLGAAGSIESIGGLLIMMGLLTRWSAFISSGEMATAYFLAQFPFAVLPIYRPPGILGESAVFNCFFFLYVAAKGPGSLSLDGWLARRHRPTEPAQGNARTAPTVVRSPTD